MIDLNAPGIIVFFGTMNAMPMMYAKELRKLGQQVVYFVDTAPDDKLTRPEFHYPDIHYPYPDWIVETVMPTPVIANLFPRTALRWMLRRAGLEREAIKAAFLSGHYVSFSPFLRAETHKVFLSYGSDLDVWCDTRNSATLAQGMRGRSIFRLLPKRAVDRLIPNMVKRNFEAAKTVQNVLYFPPSFNVAGDRVITRLQAAGVTYVPRYDISFEHLHHLDGRFKPSGAKLVILSAVRFLYRTFPEGNEQYSKGNDIIIRGLAKFRQFNPDIEVHFFEKGEDVDHAKRLCAQLGLNEVVIWHKEVSFHDLMKLHEQSDICFDQVGRHWMGSGMYALFIGKPVIANTSNLCFLGETPILHAETEEDVCKALVALSDPKYRKLVSDQSKIFARNRLGPQAVLDQLIAGREHDLSTTGGRGNGKQ